MEALESVNLFAQQDANRKRARLVVLAFILFFAWLGFGGDWIAWQVTAGAEPGEYRHVVPWFGILLVAIASAIASWSWKHGARRVLWSAGAREITEASTQEERQLVNVVEEMAIAAGIPRPRIWIVPDADPNAFATGTDERTSNVAVTEGLLSLLSRDELQAVVAHEMGHVKNLDVRLMTLLAALVGAVALINDGMGRMLRFGRVPLARGRGGRNKNLGPVIAVVLALWVLSWILAPLVTRILAMSVSRKREYLADAMAAQFTRNPTALASALEKIEGVTSPTTSIKHGSAHLCIANPLGGRLDAKQGRLADLFASHPPMALRVSRLRAMGYQERKRLGTFEETGAPAPAAGEM